MPLRYARNRSRTPSSMRECAAMSMRTRLDSTPRGVRRAASSASAHLGPEAIESSGPFAAATVEIRAQKSAQLAGGHRRAQHAAIRHLVHQLPAKQHQPKAILQRKDASHAGGGVFTHAVTDKRSRPHAIGFRHTTSDCSIETPAAAAPMAGRAPRLRGVESVPLARNTWRRSTPNFDLSSSSPRSMARRNDGSLAYRERAIPTYCAPPPGNMKTTEGWSDPGVRVNATGVALFQQTGRFDQ